MVTRIIFRQSQNLWAFNHSRKIQAVAVAAENTKPASAAYGLSGSKTGAIANSQRSV
jgi:hypothetical protein